MGIVHEAYDPKLDRRVAIKSVKYAGDPELAEHIGREARALARVDHPNIVRIHQVVEVEGETHIVMEFLAGVTLEQWAAEDRDLDSIVEVMRAAGQGLAAAHAVGLVHGDFKPANVMVCDNGRVKVMDFGLARPEPSYEQTAPSRGGLAGARGGGTPAYMAPEQFDRGWTDARSDQFAFCVTFYKVLHGVRPFAGDDREALFAAVRAKQIGDHEPRIEVPSWLIEVIERGLEPEPSRRFASLDELLDELAGPREAPPASPAPHGRGTPRAALPMVAFVAALTIAAGIVYATRDPQLPQVVETCLIQLEGSGEIVSAVIMLPAGGIYEVTVDGKTLRFKCIAEHEVGAVAVNLADGSVRYWGNVNLAALTQLDLASAAQTLPPEAAARLAGHPGWPGRGTTAPLTAPVSATASLPAQAPEPVTEPVTEPAPDEPGPTDAESAEAEPTETEGAADSASTSMTKRPTQRRDAPAKPSAAAPESDPDAEIPVEDEPLEEQVDAGAPGLDLEVMQCNVDARAKGLCK